MNFEWDEIKSERCFLEKGFDFAYAAQAFFDPNRLYGSIIGIVKSASIFSRKAEMGPTYFSGEK